MPRRPRIHYPGAIYHVIARGNNEQKIFLHDTDFNKYFSIWKETLSYLSCYVLAYALMHNHLHFLVEVGDCPLSNLMQVVQQRYTQYFHLKYNTCGHVFQGRYKAYLVKTNKYFTNLVCYIVRNPTEAGLETSPGHYRWTSHYELLHLKTGILSKDRMLSYFHHESQTALHEYLQLVQKQIDISQLDIYMKPQETVLTRSEAESQALQEVDLEDLIRKVALHFKIDSSDLVSHTKRSDVVTARKVLFFLARHYFNISGVDVAKRFGRSQEIVSRTYQSLLRTNDPEILAVIEQLKRKFKKF